MQFTGTPHLMKIAQAAKALGLSENAVRRLVQGGRLAHVPVGPKLIMVPQGAIEKFIAENTVQACPDAIAALAFGSSKSAQRSTSSGQNGAEAASAARALRISEKLKSRLPNSSGSSLAARAPEIRRKS
jgi:excisionase family DNA binding protein